MWGQYWTAHQRYFKYMCIASKVDHAVEVARQAIANGKCVVIGLQSTGQAQAQKAIGVTDGKLENYVSTAR